MLTSSLLPLLTIASIAYSLPFEGLGSPLTPRTTGQVVNGPLHASNGGGGSSAGTEGNRSGIEPVNHVAGGASGAGTSQYKMFSGDGKSWPSQDQWIGDFEKMFSNHMEILKISCKQFGKELNSDKEIQDIHDGVIAAEKASGVDKRFILATIIQESKGCVRVPTTNGGVVNPGLMQGHAGIGCDSVPCPTNTIHQMILEGTAGTAAGDGLAGCINQASEKGATGAQAFYWAARIYNTGSYTAGSDLGVAKYGTPCYSTDIANRLLGWAGSETACTLTTTG